MGTFDSVYRNKIYQLQEENKKLKAALQMIFEANDGPDFIPLAPYESEGYDGDYPRGTQRSPQTPSSPGNFWRWVRELGRNPTYEDILRWQQANPNAPVGKRYQDFLRGMEELRGIREFEQGQREFEDMQRQAQPNPNQTPATTRPVRKPGSTPATPAAPKPAILPSVWKAIKPFISEVPPTSTTNQAVASGGNQQVDVVA